MLTEKQKERIAKLGLKESDFEPKTEEQANDVDARLTELEKTMDILLTGRTE